MFGSVLKVFWFICIDLTVSAFFASISASTWIFITGCDNPFCGVIGFFTLPIALVIVTVSLFLLRNKIKKNILEKFGFLSYFLLATYFIDSIINHRSGYRAVPIYSSGKTLLLALLINGCISILILFFLRKNKYI